LSIFAGKNSAVGECGLGAPKYWGRCFGGKVIRARAGDAWQNLAPFIMPTRVCFTGLNNPLTATRYHSLIIEKENAAGLFGNYRLGRSMKTAP
jgi:anthranilate/para-aminobenzoate synthase component II